jgi:hypothetical protein
MEIGGFGSTTFYIFNCHLAKMAGHSEINIQFSKNSIVTLFTDLFIKNGGIDVC